MRSLLKSASLALICVACCAQRSLVYDSSRGVFVDERGRCWVYYGAGVIMGLDLVRCPKEAS